MTVALMFLFACTGAAAIPINTAKAATKNRLLFMITFLSFKFQFN